MHLRRVEPPKSNVKKSLSSLRNKKIPPCILLTNQHKFPKNDREKMKPIRKKLYKKISPSLQKQKSKVPLAEKKRYKSSPPKYPNWKDELLRKVKEYRKKIYPREKTLKTPCREKHFENSIQMKVTQWFFSCWVGVFWKWKICIVLFFLLGGGFPIF